MNDKWKTEYLIISLYRYDSQFLSSLLLFFYFLLRKNLIRYFYEFLTLLIETISKLQVDPKKNKMQAEKNENTDYKCCLFVRLGSIIGLKPVLISPTLRALSIENPN